MSDESLRHCELGHEIKVDDTADRVALAGILVDLVSHMWVHDGYERNGFNKMTAQQRAVYEAITQCDDDSDNAQLQWAIAAMKAGGSC